MQPAHIRAEDGLTLLVCFSGQATKISKFMKPQDVFTPRSAEVNPAMYISRQRHEEALVSALRGKLHIVIHGDSGTGKSWLYKKVLADEKACFVVANLANASRMGSITLN